MWNLHPVISLISLIDWTTRLNHSFVILRIGLLLSFVLLPLLASTSGLASEGCVTSDCHTSLGTAEFVHEPVAGSECDACHVETGKPHPGEDGAIGFELTEKGLALCFQCHDNPTEGKKLVHPPVEKDCTKCHSPHQGNHSKFLHNSIGELCLACHDQIKDLIQNAQSSHDPVAEGECLACHVPHASDNLTLFIKYYPRNTYSKYTDEKFALCFECHDSEVFTLKLSTEVTNFRNGDQNLHYVHVNRSKGRVCVNCHGVHGADQPKLIHSESPAFGVWNIPIEIQMTETGATCFVGCHKKKSYDRITKVINN